MKIRLLDIAHARSGDKGDTANVGLIALEDEWYPILVRYVTRERVAEHFAKVIKGSVERFELPNLFALNFLLHGALGGRRHGHAAHRRAGEGLFVGAAAARDRCARRRGARTRPSGVPRMMRIRVERAGAIGRITLARPEKKNALDLVAARELQEALREFAANAEVRVVVLGADGEDFCAGADLAALYALLDADAAAQLRDAEALGDVFRLLREMPQVVIAAVRGRALAGGAGLATACDLVIADEGARFGYPEVRVGFVPAMVMALLRRQIGEKRAFELAATGRQVGAREALELGLVSRVVPTKELDVAVEQLANELAAMPPEALAADEATLLRAR